jgi:small subunit ribosomal protein S13
LSAGVDIPDGKRIEIALRGIFGIGPARARKITEMAQVENNPRMGEISEEILGRVRELVDRQFLIEGDLRREVNDNIRRLIDVGSYRGSRHRRGLPVRGQRTRTNARAKRGGRRAVAGRNKVAAKK